MIDKIRQLFLSILGIWRKKEENPLIPEVPVLYPVLEHLASF